MANETPRPWYRESARSHALGGWIIVENGDLIAHFQKFEDRDFAVAVVNAHAGLVSALRSIAVGECDARAKQEDLADAMMRVAKQALQTLVKAGFPADTDSEHKP